MNEEWEKFIFSNDELEELGFSSERIIYNNDHGIMVNLGFSNEFCISLLKNWYRAGTTHDISAFISIVSFFQEFINHIEEHLNDEGIDWRLEPDV